MLSQVLARQQYTLNNKYWILQDAFNHHNMSHLFGQPIL